MTGVGDIVLEHLRPLPGTLEALREVKQRVDGLEREPGDVHVELGHVHLGIVELFERADHVFEGLERAVERLELIDV